MTALTKDGVQFSIDVYVTYRANCDFNDAIVAILNRFSPETPATRTITSDQLYKVCIRPALGEAVRIAVAPFNANDINAHRDEIFAKVRTVFIDTIAAQQGKDESGKPNTALVIVPPEGLTMNNPDFPDSMDKANAERATVAIERDKSLAEQEKIKVQIETAKLEVERQEVESKAKAKKIDIEGAALARNPEYYVRDVYYYAAQNGSAVTLPANPSVILQMTPPKK
jgi:regulator of protease activity HflC (stomatin/prohibitin superfamily)